jgi:hypothetical protein
MDTAQRCSHCLGACAAGCTWLERRLELGLLGVDVANLCALVLLLSAPLLALALGTCGFRCRTRAEAALSEGEGMGDMLVSVLCGGCRRNNRRSSRRHRSRAVARDSQTGWDDSDDGTDDDDDDDDEEEEEWPGQDRPQVLLCHACGIGAMGLVGRAAAGRTLAVDADIVAHGWNVSVAVRSLGGAGVNPADFVAPGAALVLVAVGAVWLVAASMLVRRVLCPSTRLLKRANEEGNLGAAVVDGAAQLGAGLLVAGAIPPADVLMAEPPSSALAALVAAPLLLLLPALGLLCGWGRLTAPLLLRGEANGSLNDAPCSPLPRVCQRCWQPRRAIKRAVCGRREHRRHAAQRAPQRVPDPPLGWQGHPQGQLRLGPGVGWALCGLRGGAGRRAAGDHY